MSASYFEIALAKFWFHKQQCEKTKYSQKKSSIELQSFSNTVVYPIVSLYRCEDKIIIANEVDNVMPHVYGIRHSDLVEILEIYRELGIPYNYGQEFVSEYFVVSHNARGYAFLNIYAAPRNKRLGSISPRLQVEINCHCCYDEEEWMKDHNIQRAA